MGLLMQLVFCLVTLQTPFLKVEHHISLIRSHADYFTESKYGKEGSRGQALNLWTRETYSSILCTPWNHYNNEDIKSVETENGKLMPFHTIKLTCKGFFSISDNPF